MQPTRRRLYKLNRSDVPLVLSGAVALTAMLVALIQTGWHPGVIAGYLMVAAVTIIIGYRLSRSRAEAEQRVRQLTALNTISGVMRTSLDLPELIEAIRQNVGQLVDASNFYLAVYDAERDHVSFPLCYENGERQRLRPQPVHNNLLGHVIRSRQPLLIPDGVAQAAARLKIEPPAPLPACWLGAPILTGDRVSGVIVLYSQTRDAYQPGDLNLMTTVAAQAAIAINNVQLYSTLRQRATELAILNSASTAIGATLDLERVLDIITVSISPITSCQKSAVFLLNDAGDELYMAKSLNLSPTYVEGARHIKVGLDERGLVAAQRRPLVVTDVSAEPGLSRFVPLAQAESFRALAEVPMLAQKDVVGTLAIYFTDPRQFTQAELDALQTFANQAAAAINNARLYQRTDQALARRVVELSALEEIGREFTATLDANRIAESIVERAMQVTNAQVAGLTLLNQSSTSGLFVAQRGYAPDIARDLVQKPWPATKGIIGRVLRTGQTVNLADAQLDPEYVVTDPNIRSHMAVPITREGHALGVLTLSSYQPAAFDKAAVSFAQQIANQAAIALENARLFAERMQRIDELARLNQASLALTGSLDLRQVLDHMVTAARDLTGADMVALHLYDSMTDSFASGATAGFPLSGDSISGIRPQGMTRRALQERRPIIVRDTQAEPDTNARLVSAGIRSLILVPIISRDQVLGVLNTYSLQPFKFSEADMQVISALGNQAAAAIENARLFSAVAQASDKMRAILDSSSEGILMFDLTGRVVMINPALETLLGFERTLVEGRQLTEMLDRPGLDIATQLGYSPAAILAALDQLRRSQHLADTRDVYQIARPVPRFVERAGIPVRDSAGKMVGWMIVLRDVTQERELQQMRNDLTSMIVHDLRSPLSAIYSGLLILREMTPTYNSDAMVQDTFGAAEHSCLRLINLVNSLLDISKLEAGRMKLDQQPTDLHKLFTATLTGLHPLAQEQGIALVSHVPQGWRVLVDEDKISRVLTNLVDNALKFSPPNGQVTVAAEAPGEAGFIRCSVRDEGPGIPPDHHEQIFDRFAQGPSQSGKRRGTGLGLAFCKLMVEVHGGRIWVESQGEQGSTFYFTLPLAVQ
jgi:PAS domain S-box-containing protein